MKRADSQIINIPQTNFSILLEGNISSKKEIFAKSLLEEQLKNQNKVSILSFSPDVHSGYLKEKSPETANLLTSKEASDDLTDIGITLSDLITEETSTIYSDTYSLLITKNPTETVLNAYTFNLKKLTKNQVTFIETIDPATFEPIALSKLEALFDIVIQITNEKETFKIKYKKHASEDPATEHEIQIQIQDISKLSLYNMYLSAFEAELANIKFYGDNLDLFEEEDSATLAALAKHSLLHASKFLDKIIQTKTQKENVSTEEKMKVLQEGLKEEISLGELYNKIADQTADKEMLKEIALQEKDHEKVVRGIIAKTTDSE